LSDITALITFVKTKMNDRLKKEGKEYTIDTGRICLSGGSAGGYLALIAGLPVPKSASDEALGGYRGESGIKCIAPFYPITDLTDVFWSTETNPVPWYGRT
jgi:acetyl esterase/lipase